MKRSRFSRRLKWWIASLAALIALSNGGAAHCQELPRPRKLHLIQPDGMGLTILPGSGNQTYGSPDWSPDGKWIAYDTWSAGEDYTDARIEIMRADGSEVREIGAGAMPSWSPDGKQIVAHTYDSPQTCVVMNVDGSGREVIIPHWGSPRWSPVGNRIVTAYPGSGLAVFELATGKEARILPQHSPHQGLSISPDGAHVCFASRSNASGGNGGGALMLVTLGEKTVPPSVRTLVKPGFFSHSSFSPDGKQIVFTWQPREGQDRDQLYLIDVNGSQPPKKLDGLNASLANSDPDWSPDGKLIVFSGEAP